MWPASAKMFNVITLYENILTLKINPEKLVCVACARTSACLLVTKLFVQVSYLYWKSDLIKKGSRDPSNKN